MARVIAGERDPLLACVGRKLFTYAHGKSSDDDPTRVDAIAASARAQGGTLRALIEATVLSPTFRMRRGEALQESAR
jgi:hypothetical protein